MRYDSELLIRAESAENWRYWEWLSAWRLWFVHWGHFHDELARGEKHGKTVIKNTKSINIIEFESHRNLQFEKSFSNLVVDDIFV